MTRNTTWEAMDWLFKMALRTPFNIAPERSKRLVSEIFGVEMWTIERSNEPANFFAIPEDKAIYLSAAGQASLWCLAYVAFHVMDISSQSQRAINRDMQAYKDIGQNYAALQLGEYVAFARSLFHADRLWPTNLEMPVNDPPNDSPAWHINNIYLGALSWILLHEIGHVHHGDLKFVPSFISLNQEYSADRFATTWILDDAGQGLEREFRILMIVVALTWLFLCEAEKGRSTTHPATILRFRDAVEQFQAGERSVGLENSSYLLKAVLDPRTIPPLLETPKEVFEWISKRLETLFPA